MWADGSDSTHIGTGCSSELRGRVGRPNMGGDGLILNAQLAVDGESGKYPEFKGNVATVYSKPLCRGGASNGHYGGNAEQNDVSQSHLTTVRRLFNDFKEFANSRELK